MSTDTNSNLTGQPPAVTYEQLREWERLADDIYAALKMGGEQGMELLIGLIADWCVIADEVNTAFQTCCEFASRGLRDEAIHWHAPGFFDIAERLMPDRPGWDDWAAALTEREIILPAVDIDLKMQVDAIFEDLQAINIETGHTLADEVSGLRRNMLIRGRLGERLTILQRLQAVDPGVPNWNAMMRPYRTRRADEIRREVDALVAKADCSGLCRLHSEVAGQNWDGDLPIELTSTLEAATHWRAALGHYKNIRHQTTELRVRCQEGQAEPTGTPRYGNAVAKAREHREAIKGLYQQVQTAVSGTKQCRRISEIVGKAGIEQALHELDQSCKDHLNWLTAQDRYEQRRSAFLDLDDQTASLLSKKPKSGGFNFEEYKSAAKKWQKKTRDHLLRARQLCRRAGDLVPPATDALISQLEQAEQQIELDLANVRRKETFLFLGIIGGIVIIVIVFVAAILLSNAGS
ncbi:hypothetical protein EBU58_10865 [bacterium]|nr:hypothetical protein [bacterium]